MSVCAVERRLLRLMAKVYPEEKDELEELTLGQLIGRYLNDKGKYQFVVPKKYEGLLNLCNEFRILAVHPKRKRVSKVTAQAILGLTFSFLF